MNRSIKVLIFGLLGLLALYFMPFVITDVTGSNQKTYRAPFASNFIQDDGEYISFSSIRSVYSLQKDAQNALESYGSAECYGKKYYYDSDNDISYDAIDTKMGLMNQVRYHYVLGNACAGWSMDDEIAWSFGQIEEVDLTISQEAALEKEWLVIVDGATINPSIYNNFSRLVKQGVPSYFRALILDNGTSVIDIQLLSDAKFKVLQRNQEGVQEHIYARLSEIIGDDGVKRFCAYQGYGAQEEPIVLFEVK